MKTRNLTVLGIAALLFSSCICACGGDSGTPAVTDAVSAGAETEAVSPWNDHLPERDFEGQQFRIAVFGDENCWERFYSTEQDGNLVNDAVYNKVATVEDRFNVDITFHDTSAFLGDDIRVVQRAVLAGDDYCELAQGHDLAAATASLEGVFLNLLDIPYFAFDQPWWPSQTVESMTVADQMYLMLNNISYTGLAQTRVMFFNKDLRKNLDLDDPYQLVYDGTWTMDAMRLMSAAAYSDLDGDSQRDNSDRLGYAHGENYCFLEPFLVEPYRKDENGDLYYEMNIEKMHNIATKLSDIIYGEGGLVAGGETKAEEIFADGRALFIYTNLYAAEKLFSHSDDLVYGVLPLPKLDETQAGYGAGATDRPIVIPTTAEDQIEFVGIVTEALNIEGYKQVYPAYFEVTMKSRYADQTDDAKMLDIIHDNTVISFTYMYGNNKSAYNTMLNDLFRSKTKPSSDVASWAAKHEASQEKYLEELMEFFDEHRTN